MKKAGKEFLIGVPIVIAVTILLDYLYCTLITHKDYVFDIRSCLLSILVWAIVEIVICLIRRRKRREGR